MWGHIWAFVQALLPKRALSRLAGRMARSRKPWLRDGMTALYCSVYGVPRPQRGRFASFNDFFIRPLPGPPPPAPQDALVSAVQGRIADCGVITAGTLLQAKGHAYTCASLLGGDEALAMRLEGGRFATCYLSPRDYHRVHMPLAGDLTHMLHIPGRRFSVDPPTAGAVRGLYARNERVACVFRNDSGVFAVVLVGALMVGSISTAWSGAVEPVAQGVSRWTFPSGQVRLPRGAELARFNMGSSVVLLFQPGLVADWPHLAPRTQVQVGQPLATLTPRP